MEPFPETNIPPGLTCLATAPTSSQQKAGERRRSRRKPYHGCQTCKTRKIKCDKTRPFCLGCLRTGRKCDGYPVTPAEPSSESISSVVGLFPTFESAEEARAFDFYMQKSSVALSNDIDVEVWTKLVVQLSLTEPAVRHAALAISSLHRHANMTYKQDRQKRRDLDPNERFALTQYSKAMTALRLWSPGTGDSATVPLIICLLFVAIEFLRSNQTSSQIHICQGRKMIADLGTQRLSAHQLQLLRRYIVPMYQRLGVACYLFGTVPAPIPAHLSPGHAGWPGTGGCAIFTSIEQARDQFYDMMDDVLQFVNLAQFAAYSKRTGDLEGGPHDPSRLENDQQCLLSRLEQWNAAYTAMLVTLPSMALPATTKHLLMVYYHVARTWISTALAPSEAVFDQYPDSFSSIISGSVAVIDGIGSKQQTNATDHTFSFETEVIAPLYWTCMKCRHPVMRRAALSLLQRDEMKTRRENLWSAEAIAAVSKFLIATEERYRVGQDDVSSFDRTPVAAADLVPPSLAEENVLDRLFRIPVSSPPTVCGRDNCNLLTVMSKSSDNEADSPSPPPLPSGSALAEAVHYTISAIYILSQSSSPQPPPAGILPDGSTAVLCSELGLGHQEKNQPVSRLMAPPYGIPDPARIKNLILGPMEDEGVWITIFRDPPAGKEEWDVKRTFLYI